MWRVCRVSLSRAIAALFGRTRRRPAPSAEPDRSAASNLIDRHPLSYAAQPEEMSDAAKVEAVRQKNFRRWRR